MSISKNTEPELSPIAKRRLKEIWEYSFSTWGLEQAHDYLSSLKHFVETLSVRSKSWRKYKNRQIPKQLYYQKHKKHFVFCEFTSDKTIKVISILHENMDIPARLFEDVK